MSDISATPPQPVNYSAMLPDIDPQAALLKSANIQNVQAQTGLLGQQANLTGAQANLAGVQGAVQTVALQRQMMYPQMLQQALANPTPSNFAALTSMFPDQHAGLAEGWNMIHQQQQQQQLDGPSRAYAALVNGRPDLAQQIVGQQVTALQNSGTDPSNPVFAKQMQDAQTISKLIDSDPKAAQGYLGAALSAAMGPQDFASHFSTLMTEPATIGKTAAEATTAQANASVAPEQAQANLAQTQTNVQNIQNQVQQRVAAFGLDQQKFQTDTAIRMQQLRYQQMVPNMASGMAEQQATAVAQSQQLQQSADRATGIANQIQGLVSNGAWQHGGIAGNVQMTLQDVLGGQDSVNDLKKEYASMRASAIFGQIQGGRTTDKDASIIQKGFPSDNADPDQITAWLNSYANVQRRMAQYNDAKADWISAAGSMGKLPRDGNVLGVQVPAGTSFNDFMARGLKGATSNVTPPNAAPGAMPRYMSYGQ
ncbi:hypothetical protein B0G76_2837 [Paraburkholderia sp. BL23I1N1]|uniref:hypothetical protein n=1 Tax=Paraburkholderia sp. BL23I1N1 TaxID=1938802 RepID=UPI000E719D2F|nr:hypothetical protein [Paraburkholderia sp. BL23I1N1]RKE36635.1 hypothetical protein B0G76_2837 [Paraburkholderia sp. BL23I1N1]